MGNACTRTGYWGSPLAGIAGGACGRIWDIPHDTSDPFADAGDVDATTGGPLAPARDTVAALVVMAGTRGRVGAGWCIWAEYLSRLYDAAGPRVGRNAQLGAQCSCPAHGRCPPTGSFGGCCGGGDAAQSVALSAGTTHDCRDAFVGRIGQLVCAAPGVVGCARGSPAVAVDLWRMGDGSPGVGPRTWDSPYHWRGARPGGAERDPLAVAAGGCHGHRTGQRLRHTSVGWRRRDRCAVCTLDCGSPRV